MSDYLDASHWKMLAEADPAMLCRRGRCRHDADSGSFIIRLWGSEYRIEPRRGEIAREDRGPLPHPYFNVFIVSYLLLQDEIEVAGEWVSEKDFPGGATFFRGPHLLPTKILADGYGDDLEAFAQRCQDLGGAKLPLADAAYAFTIAADLPVAVLYWIGDADFPAEAKVLFDRSLIARLPLDVVYSLGVTICHHLAPHEA